MSRNMCSQYQKGRSIGFGRMLGACFIAGFNMAGPQPFLRKECCDALEITDAVPRAAARESGAILSTPHRKDAPLSGRASLGSDPSCQPEPILIPSSPLMPSRVNFSALVSLIRPTSRAAHLFAPARSSWR